jgi:aminopeptidase N
MSLVPDRFAEEPSPGSAHATELQMRCRRSLALVVVLCGLPWFAAAAAPDRSPAALATTQLPRGVRPVHYDITVVPHAQAMRFDGAETVTIEVTEPTNRITLNAVDLTFSTVRLAPASGGRSIVPRRVDVDAGAQTATFTFARPIRTGTYRLFMAYAGIVGTQADGLFAIDYDTKAGKRRALFTQFENSDARRFMPSWDEPAYKATFSLAATVPAGQMAVSNMPAAASKKLGKGLVRVRFAPSPRMSTYLLFFGLGKFERVTTREGPTEIGIITRKEAAPQAKFALDSARAILREYNDYFGVPYPLPKLDNIASPGSSQFFAAMENWGAIYTFERALLIDPALSSQSDRQRIFTIAAHEMAHQWFGDLVTMRWWDDLWLNEGFASWMERRATQKLHPEWNTALAAVGVRNKAMEVDALRTTHAVVQHVTTADQASQAFDAVTYSKGDAVIRMLEAYVGADVWRDGVRRYMKAHAYGNTDSDDLWQEIEAAAGKPISEIAHDFTVQPGVPLLRVRSSICKAGATTLELEQAEFSNDHPADPPLHWRVPVIARAGHGAAVRAMVSDARATLVVPGCEMVVVNSGQSGYYRTLYAPAQQAAIRDSFARLDAIDQLGLLDDMWALGAAGAEPMTDVLELIAQAPGDADPQLWGDIAERFRLLDDFYRRDAARQTAWRAYAATRLAPVLARVGWQARAGEAAPLTILRAELIETLSKLGDGAAIAEARRRYAAGASDPGAVPAELRATILGVVARHADAATWNELHRAAQAEATPLVRDRFYRVLSSVADQGLARRALDLALTDEPGATNAAAMISTVAEEHPDLAFDFALAHRDRIDALVTHSAINQYYPKLAANSLDAAMIGKISAFADARIPAESRRAAEAAMAKIGFRITVSTRRLAAVDAWLETQAR